VNRPCADDMYLASKKSSPLSLSLSLEEQQDLMPESYKQTGIPVAVLEIAMVEPGRKVDVAA
jgi:hypothetical protein